MSNLRCEVKFMPQLTPDSREPTIPFGFLSTYAQKSVNELVYAGAVSDSLIPMGTILTPQCVVIQLYEGACTLKFDTGAGVGTGIVPLSRVGSPEPDSPALFLIYNPTPAAMKVYITTTGPVRLNAWFFQ